MLASLFAREMAKWRYVILRENMEHRNWYKNKENLSGQQKVAKLPLAGDHAWRKRPLVCRQAVKARKPYLACVF